MTEKRYKSISANLECSNGMEYMLIKRNDGVNICQVCSKYTAKEIVDELNSLADENKELKLKNHKLEEKVYDLLEDKQALMNFIRERFPKNYETIFEEIQVH